MTLSLIITTVSRADDASVQKAHKIAEQLGVSYIPRKGTIKSMRQNLGVEQVLTVGERLTLFADELEIFFHPSMAVVRVKRLLAGDTDTVVQKSGMQPGDTVLDCTLGMGSDSIVFSHVVGESGKVKGIEQSSLLALLVADGLQRWESDVPELDRAMRRVEVINGSHLDYLQMQPDNSVDIVYFDPMFRTTVTESVNLDPLRSLSSNDPLSLAAIHEAKRVARKSVVLKERLQSGEFERLGFPPPIRRSSAFTYSVLQTGREGGV